MLLSPWESLKGRGNGSESRGADTSKYGTWFFLAPTHATVEDFNQYPHGQAQKFESQRGHSYLSSRCCCVLIFQQPHTHTLSQIPKQCDLKRETLGVQKTRKKDDSAATNLRRLRAPRNQARKRQSRNTRTICTCKPDRTRPVVKQTKEHHDRKAANMDANLDYIAKDVASTCALQHARRDVHHQDLTRLIYSVRHNPYEPVQFFHILIVPSSLPVEYSFPSGEKLILQIGPW